MSWSTDFSKMPASGRVIVQGRGQRCAYVYGADVIRNNVEGFVAWHHAPEEYAPPKPEQITNESACWNLYRSEIIAIIEERTREIVAWEQKNGGRDE